MAWLLSVARLRPPLFCCYWPLAPLRPQLSGHWGAWPPGPPPRSAVSPSARLFSPSSLLTVLTLSRAPTACLPLPPAPCYLAAFPVMLPLPGSAHSPCLSSSSNHPDCCALAIATLYPVRHTALIAAPASRSSR